MMPTTDDTYATELRCVVCDRPYPAFGTPWLICPEHDGIDGILDVRYDLDGIRASGFVARLRDRRTTDPLRRYRELLPLRARDRAAIPQGWLHRTPLVASEALARELGIGRLLIKDDGRQPTGSLKDRSSTLAVAMAHGEGAERIACASTGNAASSLAGACARTGMPNYIFVPRSVAASKLAQIQAYGATVALVDGDYDDAYWLCQDAVTELGWFNRNCAVNPYLMEGKKTAALEIAEQLGREPVDWLSVSVGDGCTVAALHKGLVEMHELGILCEVPRILAVQASGAGAMAHAFTQPEPTRPTAEAATVASAISVRQPRNWRKALGAVRASEGTFMLVDDAEILTAGYRLAAVAGIFAEPGAAAGIAAIAKAREAGILGPDDRVVHVVTGMGLKDPSALDGETPATLEIRPRLEDVIASLPTVLASAGDAGRA